MKILNEKIGNTFDYEGDEYFPNINKDGLCLIDRLNKFLNDNKIVQKNIISITFIKPNKKIMDEYYDILYTK